MGLEARYTIWVAPESGTWIAYKATAHSFGLHHYLQGPTALGSQINIPVGD